MKKVTLFAEGLLAAILLLSSASAEAATKTWNTTSGGSWTTASNWSPSGAPAANDDVIISSNQSASITNVPTITLNSLAVSGNCSLDGSEAFGITLTVTTAFSVSSGTTLILGPDWFSRVNFTLSPTATGTINGTLTMDPGTLLTLRFTNNGVLVMGPAGLITGASNFTLASGATLKIGSAAGIATSGATGNIQVDGTRTYSTGANYIYNGTSAQVTGSGLSQNTPANVTIDNSAGVTFSAATTISGLLHLLSSSKTAVPVSGLTTANLTAENDAELVVTESVAMTVTNPAAIHRQLGSTGAWHYLCYPVATSNPYPFLTYPQSNYLKWYDEPNNAWHYIGTIQPDSAFVNKPLYGYAFWANTSTSYTFTGTLNNGIISTTVSRSPMAVYGHNGWNLVGNPYLSELDLSAIPGDWTNLEPWAWFWHPGEDPGSSGYVGGNYDVYGTTPPNGATTHDQYVPAMQGFFVKVRETGNPSSGTYRVDNGHRTFHAEEWLKNQKSGDNFIRITAADAAGGMSDKVSVYFSPAASAGYDAGEDAVKIAGDGNVPQLYTTAQATNLTIQGLPIASDNMTIPVGFTCPLPGTYSLTATDIQSFATSVNVYLQDLKTNTTQDLKTNPVYTFSHDPAGSPDRFMLLFSHLCYGAPNYSLASDIMVYSCNENIYVGNLPAGNNGGTLVVYDMIGKELFRSALENTAINKFHIDAPAGYYIARVITPGQTINRKVFLD